MSAMRRRATLLRVPRLADVMSFKSLKSSAPSSDAATVGRGSEAQLAALLKSSAPSSDAATSRPGRLVRRQRVVEILSAVERRCYVQALGTWAG